VDFFYKDLVPTGLKAGVTGPLTLERGQQRESKSTGENCSARNHLGLRFLRRFGLTGTVQGDRLANERFEGGLVNFFSFA